MKWLLTSIKSLSIQLFHFIYSSEDIIGLTLGAKSVTLPEPDPVDGDDQQPVRPCMVVVVTTEDNELELQPHIIKNVLKAIQQKHKNTDRYVPESNTETPHWMKFEILYNLEHEESELLACTEL